MFKKFLIFPISIILVVSSGFYVDLQIKRNIELQKIKLICQDNYIIPENLEMSINGLDYKITNLGDLKIQQKVIWYKYKQPIGGISNAYCRVNFDKELNIQISYKNKIIKNNKYGFRLFFDSKTKANLLSQFTTKENDKLNINKIFYNSQNQFTTSQNIFENTKVVQFEDYFFVNQNCNSDEQSIRELNDKNGEFFDYPFGFGLIPLLQCTEDENNNWQIIEPGGQIFSIKKWQNKQKDYHNSFLQNIMIPRENYSITIKNIQKDNKYLVVSYIPKVDGKDWELVEEKFIFKNNEYIYEPKVNLYPKD